MNVNEPSTSNCQENEVIYYELSEEEEEQNNVFQDNEVEEQNIILQNEPNEQNIEIREQPEQSTQKMTRSGRIIKRPIRLEEYANIAQAQTPETYQAAIKNPEWVEAINKEISSLLKLETWVEEKAPPNKHAIGTKWVFKIKEDGTKKRDSLQKGFNSNQKTSLITCIPLYLECQQRECSYQRQLTKIFL